MERSELEVDVAAHPFLLGMSEHHIRNAVCESVGPSKASTMSKREAQ